MYVHICVCVCVCVCVYKGKYSITQVYGRAAAVLRAYTSASNSYGRCTIYRPIYIYICIYTYTHTHTHAYTHIYITFTYEMMLASSHSEFSVSKYSCQLLQVRNYKFTAQHSWSTSKPYLQLCRLMKALSWLFRWLDSVWSVLGSGETHFEVT